MIKGAKPKIEAGHGHPKDAKNPNCQKIVMCKVGSSI